MATKRFMSVLRVCVGAGVGLLLAGCGVGEPYVYDRAAIDRGDVRFGKPYDPRVGITVCYSKHNATQAEVVALARQICSASGYGVRYRSNTYTVCSLTSPVGAQFECVDGEGRPIQTLSDPDAPAERVSRKHGDGMPGQPDAPLSGFREGERPLGVLFGRSDTPAAPR